MANKKGFNEYKIIGDTAIIYLKKRDGRIYETYIDTEDLDMLKELDYSWNEKYIKSLNLHYAGATEYLGTINGKRKEKTHYLHKVIMNNSSKSRIDHINHNTLDNRKSNLRLISVDKNAMNRKSKNKNNSTGYRNVSWSNNEQKFIVQLQVNGKNTQLGKFEDLQQAAIYAEVMRKKYYGEYAGKN